MKVKNYPHIQKRLTEISKELKDLSKKGIKKEVTKPFANYAKNTLSELSDYLKTTSKKREFNLQSVKTKFFTTMGIEYTFLRRWNCKKDENVISEKLISIADKRQPWNKKIHRDGDDVIEFASPAHKNWKDMLSNYKKTVSYAKKVGLICKRYDSMSGGGHIHMAIPKSWTIDFKLRFLKVFFLDISLRPYLNWIFNEALDDENANSMFCDVCGAKFMLDLIDLNYFKNDERYSRSPVYIDFNAMLNVNYKNHALRYDNEFDTIELRVFDMMENETMLEDYVEFANAYFVYIYNLTLKSDNFGPDYEIDFYKEYNNLTTPTNTIYHGNTIPNTIFDRFKNKKKTIERFNLFLDNIGLNKNKYKKYIKKNYEKRLLLNKNKDIQMDYEMIKSFPWPEPPKRKDDDQEKKCEPTEEGQIQLEISSSDLLSCLEIPPISETSEDIIHTEDVFEEGESSEVVIEAIEQVEKDPIQPSESNREFSYEGSHFESDNTMDPIKRLNSLSRIIAQEFLEKIDGTPRHGEKITITTTW